MWTRPHMKPYEIFFFGVAYSKLLAVYEFNSFASIVHEVLIRTQKPVTSAEFDIWLSVLIYQGILHLPYISDYWSTTIGTPSMKHCGISRD